MRAAPAVQNVFGMPAEEEPEEEPEEEAPPPEPVVMAAPGIVADSNFAEDDWDDDDM